MTSPNADLPARFEAATRAHREGRLDEAERLYRGILALAPGHEATLHLLGLIARGRGDHPAAVDLIGQALASKPRPDFLVDLAISLDALGRKDEAVTHLERAIALNPGLAVAHANLGNIHWSRRDVAAAAASFERAAALRPSATVFADLGAALLLLNRSEEALAAQRQALALQSGLVEAEIGAADALRDMGDTQGAAAQLESVLAREPANAEVQCNLALLELMCGDSAGWTRLEKWRMRTRHLKPRGFTQPEWRGEDLAGRTILLHAEQGAGDTFQFIRYAPLVKAKGGRVIVEVPRPLADLAATVSGVDGVCFANEALPPFDVQASLMSLPAIFLTDVENVPADVPYLHPRPEAVAAWRAKLEGPGLKVGVVWHGNPIQTHNVRRSMPAAMLAPLCADPALRWICLQADATAEELAAFSPPLEHYALGDWSDTAALVTALDLVITVDTGVAHLASALGRPVWVMLGYAADWRYLRDRADSPWYPTMRLFRQPSQGDWPGVVAMVEAALTARFRKR